MEQHGWRAQANFEAHETSKSEPEAVSAKQMLNKQLLGVRFV